MTRLGFIGTGTHARQNLYPSLRYADAELIAVAGRDPDRRAYCMRSFGAARGYGDYHQMLEREELDAVFVCGPPSLHYEAGRAVLESGRALFVEKPPAPSLDSCRELASLARERSLVCAVGFMKRSAQKYAMAREIMAKREFGDLRHLLVRYSFNVPGEGDRVFPLVSIHALDLALWFLGGADRVTIAHGGGDRASTFLTLHSDPGVIATVVLNASAPGVTERVELTGDEALITVDELATLVYYPPQRENRWRPIVGEIHAPNTALQTEENSALALQGYLGEVTAFVDAVQSADPSAVGASMDDAVNAMELVELLKSGHEGSFAI